MEKFRKKPIIIEASQFLGWGKSNMEAHMMKYYPEPELDPNCLECGSPTKEDHGWIVTKEGGHIVFPGDWVIKGIKGEFYPCKPDIFEMTYEKV